MHIALLAFGFPLATCHILYSRIIFKIEYFYFLNRINEWSFEKILGLHHVHNILGFHYTIMQWIWVGVNLSWIYPYAVVEWANDMKLDVFADQNKTDI